MTRVTLAATALLLGACTTGGTAAPDSATAGALDAEGVTWQLDRVVVDGDRAAPRFRSDITLEVEGGTVAGSVGCNSYGGSWETDGPRLTVGPDMVVSIAACAWSDPAERLLLDALPRVEEGSRDGSHLVLRGPDVELRFTG